MYCPNEDCPDVLKYGIHGEYRESLTLCPKCGAHLLPGSPRSDRGASEPVEQGAPGFSGPNVQVAAEGSSWLPGAFKRQLSPTLIAWLFICFNALVFFGCIANAVSWLSGVPTTSPELHDFSRAPAVIRVLSHIADSRGLLALLEAPFAAAGIVGGIGLLNLRSWGRTLVECLTWLGLASLVISGTLWLAVLVSLRSPAETPGSVPMWPILLVFSAGGLAVFAVMGRALLTILSNLRSPNLRAAVDAKCIAIRES